MTTLLPTARVAPVSIPRRWELLSEFVAAAPASSLLFRSCICIHICLCVCVCVYVVVPLWEINMTRAVDHLYVPTGYFAATAATA